MLKYSIPCLSEGDWDYALIDGGRAVKLVRYKGTQSAVVTPFEIQGLPVTVLGCCAFTGNPYLSAVRLSDSICLVENGSGLRKTGAFRACSQLREVILSTGITRIADYMFYGAASAQEAPLQVDFSGISEIGDFAFACCNHIVRLKLPTCVEKIGTGAFYQARRLAYLDMPGVYEIASDAFTETMFEEAYETKWKEGTFSGIVYADKVAYLYMCRQTPETELTIPSGTLGLSEGLFSNRYCNGAAFRTQPLSVMVPPSVQFVGDRAFEDFSAVELYGAKGSCAENYAAAHTNVRFQAWPDPQ
ncbi:MAG: leucine-rich repeat domain-containing protein [Faecousia sp.]